MRPQSRKIDEPVDLAQQVTVGDVPLKAEAVEKRLHHPPLPIIGRISCAQEKGISDQRSDHAEFMESPAPPSGVVGSPEFQEEEGASSKRMKVQLAQSLASSTRTLRRRGLVRWWPRKRIFGLFYQFGPLMNSAISCGETSKRTL